MSFIIEAVMGKEFKATKASSLRAMHDLCAELTASGWIISNIDREYVRKGL